MKTNSFIREAVKILILSVLGLIAWGPLFLAINMSFKTRAEIMRNYFDLPSWPLSLFNYIEAWEYIKGYLLNSIYVSGVSVIFTIVVASFAAYAFAHMRFAGKKILFSSILILLLMPEVVTLIPRFVLARDLRILYTHWGLILPYVALSQPIAVLLMRNFFSQFPHEIIEAAKVDGASDLMIYFKMILPLSLPIIITAGILNIQWTWNRFIWPLIALRDESMYPITVGLSFLSSDLVGDYGPLMASYVISAVPMLLLFMFTMKYFVRGMTSGAMKG